MTPHCDWKEVIETLRAKFHTVKLPKSFVAVNLSDAFSWSEKQHLDGHETPDAGDVLEMRKAPERAKADKDPHVTVAAPAASEDLTQVVSAPAAAQDEEGDFTEQEGETSETKHADDS